jgi:hypothetical protein
MSLPILLGVPDVPLETLNGLDERGQSRHAGRIA